MYIAIHYTWVKNKLPLLTSNHHMALHLYRSKSSSKYNEIISLESNLSKATWSHNYNYYYCNYLSKKKYDSTTFLHSNCHYCCHVTTFVTTGFVLVIRSTVLSRKYGVNCCDDAVHKNIVFFIEKDLINVVRSNWTLAIWVYFIRGVAIYLNSYRVKM